MIISDNPWAQHRGARLRLGHWVTRPPTVTAAFLLVLLQILIAVIATITAALAPADYKTYAVTTPVFLVVLYGAVAFYLWVGRPWARVVTMLHRRPGCHR